MPSITRPVNKSAPSRARKPRNKKLKWCSYAKAWVPNQKPRILSRLIPVRVKFTIADLIRAEKHPAHPQSLWRGDVLTRYFNSSPDCSLWHRLAYGETDSATIHFLVRNYGFSYALPASVLSYQKAFEAGRLLRPFSITVHVPARFVKKKYRPHAK